jgi:Ca2+-dependent lipid-binding protein
MSHLHGTVTIKDISCQDLGNSDGFGGGKSDPYCYVTLDGKQVGRTKTVNNSLSPKWDDTVTFHVNGTYHKLQIVVYDNDVGGDDNLGHYLINLHDLVTKHHIHVKHEHMAGTYKGAQSKIEFEVKYDKAD